MLDVMCHTLAGCAMSNTSYQASAVRQSYVYSCNARRRWSLDTCLQLKSEHVATGCCWEGRHILAGAELHGKHKMRFHAHCYLHTAASAGLQEELHTAPPLGQALGRQVADNLQMHKCQPLCHQVLCHSLGVGLRRDMRYDSRQVHIDHMYRQCVLHTDLSALSRRQSQLQQSVFVQVRLRQQRCCSNRWSRLTR